MIDEEGAHEAARARVAHAVRRLRNELGLTQESLAQSARMAPRHLQKVEVAEINMALNSLIKIASALEVDVSLLLLSWTTITMCDFERAFPAKMLEKEPVYEVRGFLTTDDRVYPLGTETKVLSTVFELVVRPLVFEVAEQMGLMVHEPTHQNYYPDVTLMRGESDQANIAVDVKSTYREFRRDGTWKASFTLGSYTSLIRSNTKNIAFPYREYATHYIIGFIYSQTVVSEEHFYPLDERTRIECPFADVEWFIQEKHRIARERPGSGNTANIGPVVASSVDEFARGAGPLAEAGEDVFLDYWRNYGRTSSTRPYRNLALYYIWKQDS